MYLVTFMPVNFDHLFASFFGLRTLRNSIRAQSSLGVAERHADGAKETFSSYIRRSACLRALRPVTRALWIRKTRADRCRPFVRRPSRTGSVRKINRI